MYSTVLHPGILNTSKMLIKISDVRIFVIHDSAHDVSTAKPAQVWGVVCSCQTRSSGLRRSLFSAGRQQGLVVKNMKPGADGLTVNNGLAVWEPSDLIKLYSPLKQGKGY